MSAAVLVTSLASLIRKYKMYPSGHPTIDSAVSRLRNQFESYLEIQPQLDVGIGKDTVYIGDKELTNDESVNSICGALHENSVTRLVFHRGLRSEELSLFLETLQIDPLEARNNGGYKQILSAKGVRSIDVTEIDYKLEISEIESQLEALSDAEIWRRFAKGQAGSKTEMSKEQSELIHHLLQNVPRLSMILDSAIGQNESTKEADRSADMFINTLMNMAFEAKKKSPQALQDFGKQAAKLVAHVNPKSRFALYKKCSTNSSKATRSFFGALVAEMTGREFARGLFEGLNPKSCRMNEFCNIYEAFVNAGNESAVIDQVDDFVRDHSFDDDKTFRLMIDRVQRLPDQNESLTRLRKAINEAYVKQSEAVLPLVEFMEKRFIDSDENEAHFAAEDTDQIAMQNLLGVINNVKDAQKYSDLIKGMDEQIVGLIESGQYRLAWKAAAMLEKHADQSETAIAKPARELLDSLQMPNLADDLISALSQWGKAQSDSLGGLLLMLGQCAHAPLLNALCVEESRASRAVLIDILSKSESIDSAQYKKYLGDSKWYVVRNMINLLSKLSPDDLITCLSQCADHSEPRVRKEVARTLATIQTPEAIGLLEKLIVETGEGVASQAALSLGYFKNSENAAGVLEKQLERRSPFGGDRATEKIALESLGRIRFQGSIESLANYFTHLKVKVLGAQDEGSIQAAALALAVFESPDALKVLKKGAKSWTKMIRRACKEALAKTKGGRS
jgi:hypothetical protein